MNQAEYRGLHRRLALRKNKFDRLYREYVRDPYRTDENAVRQAAEDLHTEAGRALALFEVKGYPDTWHEWNIAQRDAETSLRYL